MKNIALHILDIVQNSISAGAKLVNIEVVENISDDKLHVIISDNGKGMDRETTGKVTDPYYTSRTTRKVGLGIPLLKHNAEQSGGVFDIFSEPGSGTLVKAVFRHSHLDRPPKGDIAGVISMMAGANPSVDFVYRHVAEGVEYLFDTREVKEVLEDIPISEPSVIRYMKEMIHENLEEMGLQF